MLDPGAQPAPRASTGSPVNHQPRRARHTDGQGIARSNRASSPALGPSTTWVPPSDWLKRSLAGPALDHKMGLIRWWYLPRALSGFVFGPLARKRGRMACGHCMRPPPLGARFHSGLAALRRLRAYSGRCRGSFLALTAKNVGAWPAAIVCAHHPSVPVRARRCGGFALRPGGSSTCSTIFLQGFRLGVVPGLGRARMAGLA